MIAAGLRPASGTWERKGYESALADLWADLARTLHGLEAVAATPRERLADEDVLERLPALQYRLHQAGELVLGLEPPPGAEAEHAELTDALVDARDATGEVLEAAEEGGADAAFRLVHEWRGALFRVRLARMRLHTRPEPAPVGPTVPTGYDRGALLATVLVLAGTLVVTGGAVLGAWPVWAAGLLLVAGSLLGYRP